MTTPLDIITLALKDCGAIGTGQTPSAEDVNDAYTRLQWMLAQWQRKRWLIWHLLDLSVVSTGAQSYTIGPTGNIVTPTRPDRIEAAFIRQLVAQAPNNPDYQLKLLQSREDYNKVALKNLSSFPSYLFYDSAYPTGVLYPWPLPQAGIYELHVTVKEILAQFTSLNENLVLPEEYMAALHYNLTVRLYPAYRLDVDPVVVALAKDALNVLRESNVQIAELDVPPELQRQGIYNPYSDQER